MYNKFEQEKNINKDRQAEIDHIHKYRLDFVVGPLYWSLPLKTVSFRNSDNSGVVFFYY